MNIRSFVKRETLETKFAPMKKARFTVLIVLVISASALTLAFGSAWMRKEFRTTITTNYFDIDPTHLSMLKEILQSDDLTKLSTGSIEVMADYFMSHVLNGTNPIRNHVLVNYFWNIYNALPDFVNPRERHQGYYSWENVHDLPNQLIAYSIYRLDRSPENLQRAFRYGRPLITRLMSADAYYGRGLDEVVSKKLRSYENIIKVENYSQRLAQAYMHADTLTGLLSYYDDEVYFNPINPAYGLDVYTLNTIITSYLFPGSHIHFHSHNSLSFWMRRNHEGNMEVVYHILLEIEDMFQ